MKDTIQRIISLSGNLFGIACDTTLLVSEACRRHDTGPTAAAALARAITGNILLAALLKEGQSVQLIFEGDGPLGKVVTEAGSDGWARGYVTSPHAEIPLKNGLIDVSGGVGRTGFLRVIKDIGMEKKYTGLVQLYTGEIGEDIAYYLTESEQTPSTVSLGAHFLADGTVVAAGGYLVQSLPPADDNTIVDLEQKIVQLGTVTSQLMAGQTPSQILSHLFSDIPHKQTDSRLLAFRCNCSREKMEDGLHTLKDDDLDYLLQHDNEIVVKCDYCSDRYVFSRNDIETIIQKRKMC